MVVYKQYDWELWTESVTELAPDCVTELFPHDEDHNFSFLLKTWDIWAQ